MKTAKINKKIKNVKFSDSNKMGSLQEYILECEKGHFELLNIVARQALHFDNVAAYQNFTNNLLTDCEELKGLEDNNNAAAVYLNGQLKFIIVTEGHDYARYVGII